MNTLEKKVMKCIKKNTANKAIMWHWFIIGIRDYLNRAFTVNAENLNEQNVQLNIERESLSLF